MGSIKLVRYIAYRFLSDTDFFNMYKKPGTEQGGGGQTYIDFPTHSVTIADWEALLEGIDGLSKDRRAQGPEWRFPVRSVGTTELQQLTIYQRRTSTVSVSSQNMRTSSSKRVYAWRPDKGFPEPANPESREGQRPSGLAVYFARTEDAQIWAGWFRLPTHGPGPVADESAARILAEMLGDPSPGSAGFVRTADAGLRLDVSSPAQPFQRRPPPIRRVDDWEERRRRQPHAEGLAQQATRWLFREDAPNIDSLEPHRRQYVRTVYRRNRRAVEELKQLYGHKCQVTGSEFVFEKRDGTGYVEVHHLVPLGQGGFDDPRNMVVVSAHVHRMLHYAAVQRLDLARIEVGDDGWGRLDFVMNGRKYRLQWHPAHAAAVQQSGS